MQIVARWTYKQWYYQNSIINILLALESTHEAYISVLVKKTPYSHKCVQEQLRTMKTMGLVDIMGAQGKKKFVSLTPLGVDAVQAVLRALKFLQEADKIEKKKYYQG